MSRARSVLVALVLSVSLIGSTGCNRYGWEIFRGLAEVAAYVAVTAMVLSAHDGHYHHSHCGHQYVVYDARPVYQYDGRWEYYDSYDDTWYYYPDGLPGY